MERRVLPTRQSRNRPPPRTQQEEEQENKLYQQIFGDLQARGNQAELDAQNDLIHNYTDMMRCNIINYPYSRGSHYIFPLDTLERVENTHSYVYDKNILKVTFSQQQADYNGSKLKQLINREMFGLPLRTKDHRSRKTRDKNICHSFLFACQDKKYKIDLAISELNYVLKNLQKLIEQDKLVQYSFIKRDMELFAILVNRAMNLQQKKQLIQKKLRILHERRSDMQNGLFQEDKIYYQCTLNQKLFNQIQASQEQYTVGKMLTKLAKPELQLQQFDKVNDIENHAERTKIMKKLLTFECSSTLSVTQQICGKLTSDKFYKKIFKRLDISKSLPNHPYYFVNDVILPSIVLDFANMQLFEKTEQFVAQKLYQISDAIFYIFRSCWKKLFDRDVQIKPILKSMARDQYTEMAIKDIDGIKSEQKMNGENKLPSDEATFKYPLLDSLINFEKLENANIPSENNEVSQFMIFKPFKPISINTKEYLLIAYFHLAYKNLGELLKNTNNLSLNKAQYIICSEFYGRIHPYLSNMINNPKFGALEDIFKRICDLVPQVGHELQIKIMFDWNTDKRVGLVWTQQEEQNDWQTQKQDDLEISSLSNHSNNNEKQQQVQGMSKPKKKVKRE